MRAVVVESLSGPQAVVLRDIPSPAGAHPRANGRRVLIEVHAAGLSFIDPLQTRGRYQAGVDPPYVCGSELAGKVLEAPSDSWVKPGDRVCGIVWQGAMAEEALALEDFMVKLPDNMPYVEGAAIYMNFATAWYALDRAGAAPGETVLVSGAAGGVGTALLGLRRLHYRVGLFGGEGRDGGLGGGDVRRTHRRFRGAVAGAGAFADGRSGGTGLRRSGRR